MIVEATRGCRCKIGIHAPFLQGHFKYGLLDGIRHFQKGKRPLKTVYPSKTFFIDSADAIKIHELLEVSIAGGWRGRILAKEVEKWLPMSDINLLDEGRRGPSWRVSMLMVCLHGIYYTALSANYYMQTILDDDHVTLIFRPQ